MIALLEVFEKMSRELTITTNSRNFFVVFSFHDVIYETALASTALATRLLSLVNTISACLALLGRSGSYYMLTIIGLLIVIPSAVLPAFTNGAM